MSEKHTRGRLAADGHVVLFSDNAGGFDISACPSPEANARRLVACWNACDGLDTESIEEGDKATSVRLMHQIRELRIQRDELLAALERARPHLCVGYSAIQRHEITKVVDSAIAKVKGGAA